MSDNLLEIALVAAQDQYGDPPAKYSPGHGMPASRTVPVRHDQEDWGDVNQPATFTNIGIRREVMQLQPAVLHPPPATCGTA